MLRLGLIQVLYFQISLIQFFTIILNLPDLYWAVISIFTSSKSKLGQSLWNVTTVVRCWLKFTIACTKYINLIVFLVWWWESILQLCNKRHKKKIWSCSRVITKVWRRWIPPWRQSHELWQWYCWSNPMCQRPGMRFYWDIYLSHVLWVLSYDALSSTRQS